MKKVIRPRTLPETAPLLPDMHPVLARLYALRGVTRSVELERALKGLAPAAGLKGLERALDVLEEAVRAGLRLLVVGDFDADGATSTTLAVLALRAMGADVDYLVPNRFEYGYGLTPEIVALAVRSKSPQLIVTVDNGISSLDGVLAAQAAGIRVLITDHHLPGAELPAADAIVNPNQPDCGFPSKHLAGVGVIFYLLSSLRTRLRQSDWFGQKGLPEPVMADYLDLVALGTVADVVPLDANNRVLVFQGLSRIRAGRCRPGITALLAVANKDPARVVATDLAFQVGPRLNAAGRLDDMAHGIECLLTDSAELAQQYASELDGLNLERRNIESGMQQEAMAAIRQLRFEHDRLPHGLVLFDRYWHQGVIGIVAGRIKERYHRPVIAFAPADNEGEGGRPLALKGSARSIPGVHVRDVLDTVAALNPGLITRFGGHAMAAGLTLPADHLAAFRLAFDAAVKAAATPEHFEPVLLSDGELPPECFSEAFVELLREAGPWGQGFPEPLFHGEFVCLEQRLLKEKHLKMSVSHPAANRVFDAIAFNVDRERWPNESKRVRLAYRLDINEWRGSRTLQLLVEYLEPVT
ncbi:MAG: single-stranded-DNA-specific exonuclease RecJ [Pseudomonadota bacterium]